MNNSNNPNDEKMTVFMVLSLS